MESEAEQKAAHYPRRKAGWQDLADEGVWQGCLKKTVYISFDNNQRMKDLFLSDLDVDRIVTGLEL